MCLVPLILLQRYQIHHIPILNAQEQLVGIITYESLLHVLGAGEPSEGSKAPETVGLLAPLGVEMEAGQNLSTMHFSARVHNSQGPLTGMQPVAVPEVGPPQWSHDAALSLSAKASPRLEPTGGRNKIPSNF